MVSPACAFAQEADTIAAQAATAQTAAPQAPAQPSLPVQLSLDQAAFAYDEDASLLEVYLAVEAASLPFTQDSLGYSARFPLDLRLMRSTDAVLEGTPEDAVWADSVELAFHVTDTSSFVPGQRFVHQVRTSVPPGEYELAVVIPPDASGARQRLELRRDVIVPDFADSQVGLSDVTLATSVEQSDDRDQPFYKHGLLISPSTDQLFGKGLDDLYYYAEAYNTPAIAGDDGQYTLYAYLAEANRPQPLPDFQQRSQREARAPDVLVGQFNLSCLPSGSYFLRLALLNEENEAVVEQARKFFVYNPDVLREVTAEAGEESFETSSYASMPEDEVEQALGHIRSIATEQEQRRATRIQDLDEQRRFLMEFWQKRDPNAATAANEYKQEFYRRLQYANERYSARTEEGWQTDRGRILIKYGPPASIEPHLFDRGLAPHEIWAYNNIPGEGQATFIFADRDGFGTFELIHSTVAGERKLANWEQELQQ
ncbi:MAG: GWxTD domain-containing protein [Rhodothermales bacterium]